MTKRSTAAQRVSVSVLAERIDAHNDTLVRHMRQTCAQHRELTAQIAAMRRTTSDSVSAAHRRIDKIWITVAASLVSLAGTLIVAVIYLLYEGAPWQ